MLKGTLKNNTTGDTLTVENVSNQGVNGILVNIVGDGSISRVFDGDDWDFIETTPTADEFVLSLPVGTVFESSSCRYVKVSETKLYNFTWDKFTDIVDDHHKYSPYYFTDTEPITIKEN